jgi:hypothetical protein
MKLLGPFNYEVSVKGENGYTIVCPKGTSHFHAPVTKRKPKLYVFSDHGRLLYIGQTIQGMSARMRLGFKADGASGYWGYAWRKSLPKVSLHIWCLEGVNDGDALKDLECIESEVIFLYRSVHRQWPKYQTEIHFHESTPDHRTLASEIFILFNQ